MDLEEQIELLRGALGDLMDAVGDMPADPADCWPEEWENACFALEQTKPQEKK